MDKTENKKSEENKTQKGCCDFSSEELSKMMKMMQNFCGDRGMEIFNCCKMMKDKMSDSEEKIRKAEKKQRQLNLLCFTNGEALGVCKLIEYYKKIILRQCYMVN